MTRYDALAVIAAAENLARFVRPKMSPADRRELSRLLVEIRRRGKRSARLIERMNRMFVTYKALVPVLDRAKTRLEREVGRARLRLIRAGVS